jgi:hypothetical protein
MKHITKLKLAAVHQLCDKEDRSTEYMLQLMQDSCGVDLECCLKYMEIPNKQELFQEVNDFCNLFMKLTEHV